MARPYHSPSSISTGLACPRKWAYAYIAGIREPETKAQALGTAIHAAFEGWYGGQEVDWTTPAGRIAHAGTHLLPHPAHCRTIEIERGIGSTPLEKPAGSGPRPITHALEVHGVRWAGFRDLLVAPDEVEAERLALPANEAITHDYKSTSDIGKWAKDAATLLTDVQCNLYGLDGALRAGDAGHWCRWMYFQTRGASRSSAILVRIERDRALEVLEKPAALARELDTLERVEDAPMNPGACGDYGGCKYHRDQGGPCNARPTYGALLSARINRKKDKPMATPNWKEKFAQKKAAAEGSTPTPAEDAAPEQAADVAEAPDAPPAESPAPAPTAMKPKPATRASKKGATAPAGGGDSRASTVLQLSEKLAAANAALIEAQSNVDAVMQEIAAALAA